MFFRRRSALERTEVPSLPLLQCMQRLRRFLAICGRTGTRMFVSHDHPLTPEVTQCRLYGLGQGEAA